MSEILDRFANLSLEQRKFVLKKLQEQGLAPAPERVKQQAPPIVPAARGNESPLSFTQERLWFIEQFLSQGSATGGSANIVQAARLTGRINIDALRHSLDEIVRRHEALRTTIVSIGGRPVQVIAPQLSLPVPVIDLRHLPPAGREAETQRFLKAEVHLRLDLAQGPLLRASLLKLEKGEYVLLLNLHHLISDGWSMGVLFRELIALYQAFSQGQPSPLPELSIQYADYVHWQRGRLEGEGLNAQLDYWKRQLGDAPAVLDLPTDYERPPVQTFRAGEIPLAFPRSLSQALYALSRREESSLFMTILAVLNVLLYRYTRQEDICVGTVMANRVNRQLEELIGFFLNHIVLRTDLSGNPTFRELLRRVQDVTLEAHANQDLPFDKVLEQARPERDRSRNQLFQVMMILENMPIPRVELAGLLIQSIPTGAETHIDVDLSLVLWETEEGLGGIWDYKQDLYEAATMQRMVRHFKNLLTAVVANPDAPIAALPMLTPEEEHHLTIELNQTQTDYPANLTIQQLFEAQVARTPNALAVSMASETLTYAQLNARANQLAHYLNSLGIGPGALVGIALNRSLEMIVALLGVLKAGAAYLPLDPAYPPERLALMLDDAQIGLLLTQKALLTNLPKLNARVIALDGAEQAAIAAASTENLDTLYRPEQLAYVIYTSGSTGRPKGVMVPQRALVQYVTAAIEAFGITPTDHVLQFASLSFDTAAEEIYPCLLSGAQLVLRRAQVLDSVAVFLQSCAADQVSVLDLPTAYWHLVNTDLEAQALNWPDSLRLIILGGEKALPEQVQTWRANAPTHVRLVNTYGPTEATIVTTMCDLTGDSAPESANRAPIGRPVVNTQVYVLDPYMQLVPIGVPGELYIGGDGLAWGYLGRPDLTAERFVPNPFRATEDRGRTTKDTASFGGPRSAVGGRLYKTGDLVRYLSDGNLEFLGRVDRQVKIRGFRIELDEIQTVLNGHPTVREALALAREDAPGEKRLVAYAIPQTGRSIDPSELRDFLKTKLPDYMIPAAIMPLDTLPLTPSGKIDWRALPDDKSRSNSGVQYVAPQDPVEETLAKIWSQVLGIEQIGLHDNFFNLGGHSLLATQVIYQINQALQMNLSVGDLFQEPTVGGLAMTIKEILLDELEAAEE